MVKNRRQLALVQLQRGCKGSAFKPIGDAFRTLEDVTKALRAAGLESSNLIIGIDFTKSNEAQGERTFGGRCLHAGADNPYTRAITVIGHTLESFDDDNLIPCFIFGDLESGDHSVRREP
jgi:E3 ubiquitin-protein ligase RGLG